MRRLAPLLFLAAPLVAEAPFSDLQLEAALARAKATQRLVLVDFYTTWCGPCKQMDKTTWPHPEVRALLEEKTIALKVDAERDTALAEQYKISGYPTVLLLRPDGTEVDRFIGASAPEAFLSKLRGVLGGKSLLDQAREGVSKAQKQLVEARQTLAERLVIRGEDAEALTHYLWLYDEGMKGVPGYSGVRNTYLLSDLKRLAARHPPALTALHQRRDQARTALLARPDQGGLAADLFALTKTLDEPRACLELHDQSPEGSPVRAALASVLWEELLEQKRYREALIGRPLAKMLQQFDTFEAEYAKRKSEDMGPTLLERYVKRLAQSAEVLAGAGIQDQASALARRALALSDTPETRTLLRTRLARAGREDLVP